LVTLGLAVIVVGALTIGHAFRSTSTLNVDHANNASLTAYADRSTPKLTQSCDRIDPRASLGLRAPTLVSRVQGETALLFSNHGRYSFCAVGPSKGVGLIHPVAITRRPQPMYELESTGSALKVPGRPLYHTDMWFVVRVSSAVSSLKVVTDGTSEVSAIHGGFAVVHESAVVDLGGKQFSYGELVGFSVGGALVGSAVLK
jgi:hypothetical protein